jgi:hypothetical protein
LLKLNIFLNILLCRAAVLALECHAIYQGLESLSPDRNKQISKGFLLVASNSRVVLPCIEMMMMMVVMAPLSDMRHGT